MTIRTLLAAAVLCVAATLPAQAAPTACAEHYLGGAAPDLLNPKLAARATELCYSGYAVLHSGITRTPLYAAEHLTRERVRAAKGLPRDNTFHAEERLARGERAELSDYTRSGYDRGHVAPSGDMPDKVSQDESFSLANMMPQDPDNNRNLWEGIESAVRTLTLRDGEVFVVSGPIFEGASLKRIGNVFVPTRIFKAIYDTQTQQAGAYLVRNEPGMAWEAVSIAQIEAITGVAVFPALPKAIREAGMPLPTPTPHGHGRGAVQN